MFLDKGILFHKLLLTFLWIFLFQKHGLNCQGNGFILKVYLIL